MCTDLSQGTGLTDDENGAVDAVLRASRALVAIAARSLAEVGEDVTLAQYRALVVLASRGPRGLSALAEALAVTGSTATRMCDRLVRKNLVARREEPSDRRQVRISLTPTGRRLVAVVTSKRRAEIARVLWAIPREEQPGIVDALRRLSAAAGEISEQDWSSGWDL